LLALLIPLFLGLQLLLEREESLAAEAARAALPTPTAVVIEVPVTIERVVERTVLVPVPAKPETPPNIAPVAEIAQEAQEARQASAEASVETPPAPDEVPQPVAEEPTAPPALRSDLTTPARQPVGPVAIAASIADPSDEPNAEDALSDDESDESAGEAPEGPSVPVVRQAFGVLRMPEPDSEAFAPAAAEPEDADMASVSYASEPDPEDDDVEGLAAAVDAVDEPGDDQGGDGQVEEGTIAPAFGVLVLSEEP
jgi:hypothetical protein